MRTSPIDVETLRGSVISVPPLARTTDGSPSREENGRIIDWLAAGGVSSFMYGGNANAFHLPLDTYARSLDLLAELVPLDAWLLPALGPDFGKAMAQVGLLRERGFPTGMLLPSSAPTTSRGLADGIRLLSDAFGGPLVVYVKTDRYIDPAHLGALVGEGRIAAIKYAVVRDDPADDTYLSAIIAACGVERVVSGIGERPAIVHWQRFGIRAFTSGSVCVAPQLSTDILRALQAGDVDRAEGLRGHFLPLEDLRDAHSPILVLHAAVQAAAVAQTGEIGPYLSNLEDAAVLDGIRLASQTLRRLSEDAMRVPA
jgi:dihydrodipicolinate synthase/N-acetylneuraminate lyase